MSNNRLNRFLEAQQNTYSNALAEIKQGRKSGHWMWFIFPQLKGLGFSTTSEFYGIDGRDEALEFLENPVLGARLMEISGALLQLKTNDAMEVMGSPDHMKLRSSMTLFSLLPGSDPVFEQVLEKYFTAERDKKTLEILAGMRVNDGR